MLTHSLERIPVLRSPQAVGAEGHAPIQRIELDSMSPQEIYDRLGPEKKWMEHIDRRHHEHGPEVYTQGKHGRKADPNYNESMMDADRYVASTFGRPFNALDYHHTHFHALPNKHDYGSKFRTGELPVRFERFKSKPEKLRQENTSPEGTLPPLVKSFEPDSEHDGLRGAHVVLADLPKEQKEQTGMDESSQDVYTSAIQKILDHYEQGKQKAVENGTILDLIVHTHKSLENLHPYVDANTRTNRLVLNRMLAENKLPPTLLNNPLDVHHTEHEDWKGQIIEGQKAWMEVADQTAPPTQEWKNHDFERGYKIRTGIKKNEGAPFSSKDVQAIETSSTPTPKTSSVDNVDFSRLLDFSGLLGLGDENASEEEDGSNWVPNLPSVSQTPVSNNNLMFEEREKEKESSSSSDDDLDDLLDSLTLPTIQQGNNNAQPQYVQNHVNDDDDLMKRLNALRNK